MSTDAFYSFQNSVIKKNYFPEIYVIYVLIVK
jgi:hypothetical protein